MGYCERSLRAQTPMGERISIAKSETVPEGSTIEFEVECLDPKLEDMVRECLNYGRMQRYRTVAQQRQGYLPVG